MSQNNWVLLEVKCQYVSLFSQYIYTVTYYLKIPFVRVAKKCDAYTSFDHVGGWNHTPALSQRKKQLKGALMNGQKLDISDLKITKEGLQEYWIQWKNKITQAECE